MDVTNPLLVPPAQERNKMDLQKMLIDERIRCDTHKTNYQVLKEQHKLLQDENVKLQQQLARFKASGVESAEGLQSIINDLRGQLASKDREMETVRSQTMNPQRLEVIKAEITKELEGPLKDHVEAMDREVEKYRSEYNKLRYEHTFLKSEYEHLKSDHKRILEEQLLRHQSQMAALQQERDEAIKAYQDRPLPNANDTHKIQMLQRTKSQLELRVKNLLEEIQEINKQKERVSSEADQLQRSQAKDISQLQGNLKSMESERRSVEAKCDRLQREVQSNSEHSTRLTQQLQDKTKECSSLKSMMDEESHKHKVEMANYKLKEMKVQGDLEREKDSLMNRVRSLETELDVAKHSMDEHLKQLDEMERDAVRRVQEAKQEEWSKNHSLQTEKIALEEKCGEMERRIAEHQESRLSEREQNEERLRALEANENILQSEATVLRSKVESMSKVAAGLEREQENCAALRQKIHDKELELQTALSGKQQLTSELQRLREEVKSCRKMADDAKVQAEKAQAHSERAVEDQRLVGMEERHRLQSRIDELEHKLSRSNEQGEKSVKRTKKMQQLMGNKIRNLKNRNELLEAQKEQLEIELKAGKHGVPMQEYNALKKRLSDLRRRHNEFARTLGLPDHDRLVLQNMTSAHYNTVLMPLASTYRNAKEPPFQDSLYEKDLSQIRERLDHIEEQQRAQDEMLDEVAKPLAERKPPSPSPRLKFDTQTSDHKMPKTSSPIMLSLGEEKENLGQKQDEEPDNDHTYSSDGFESESDTSG